MLFFLFFWRRLRCNYRYGIVGILTTRAFGVASVRNGLLRNLAIVMWLYGRVQSPGVPVMISIIHWYILEVIYRVLMRSLRGSFIFNIRLMRSGVTCLRYLRWATLGRGLVLRPYGIGLDMHTVISLWIRRRDFRWPKDHVHAWWALILLSIAFWWASRHRWDVRFFKSEGWTHGKNK